MNKSTIAHQLADIFRTDEFVSESATIAGYTSDWLHDFLSEFQIAQINESTHFVIESNTGSYLAEYVAPNAYILIDGSVFFYFDKVRGTDAQTYDILRHYGFVIKDDETRLGGISIELLDILKQSYQTGGAQ